VSELDDLDQLEREFGAALRVALRRVAADIPDDASVWSPGPIFRLRRLDTDHLDPDEQLVPLEQVTVSANTATGKTRNRRRLLIAAAAIVVAIGVAGIALATTNHNDQSPAPAATVSVAPTTTVGLVLPSANDIRVTFTVPRSWAVFDEEPFSEVGNMPASSVWSSYSNDAAAVQFDSVSNIYSAGCSFTLLDPPVGPTVDDLVTAWANVPELAATTPVDITVDGYTGKQIELTLPVHDLCSNHDSFGVWWGRGNHAPVRGFPPRNGPSYSNQHFQMLVLDVDGTRLLIAASTYPTTRLQDRAALEELLASIQIGPPAHG
jgi:hypothetical protein